MSDAPLLMAPHHEAEIRSDVDAMSPVRYVLARRLLGSYDQVKEERDRFKTALDKIDKIRDSIIGKQGFNFSEHAYPLVAALKAAGYEGAGYEIARKDLGTLIDQANALETALRGCIEAHMTNHHSDGSSCPRPPRDQENRGPARVCLANDAADTLLGTLGRGSVR